MNTLITQIARCGEVEKAKTDINHPCNKIVCSQNGHAFNFPNRGTAISAMLKYCL